MEQITIHIEAEIHPTESEEKVKKAIENLFAPIETNTQPAHRGTRISADAKGREALVKLHNIMQRERIRAAARTVMLEGADRKSINFCLNKQVAYAGHISFATETAESLLGPIKVKIQCENPRDLINWLTFETM